MLVMHPGSATSLFLNLKAGVSFPRNPSRFFIMTKLNIGCGKRNFGSGWLHIDAAKYPHIISDDIYANSFNNVSVIYSSHLLEYFDRDEGEELLTSWYNVLVRGGQLRIAVPDFQAISDSYHAGEYEIEQYMGMLYGKMKMNDGYIYHKTAYDYRSLNKLLAKVGFTNIERVDSIVPIGLDDHSEARLPHRDKSGRRMSLNVIAIK